MKISVLVPVFNVELYLADCIESVIKQTHNDFELVLVDDGSTDKSYDICVQYVARYPNQIKVITIPNGGPLKARVVAMEEAVGDVFVFLDADDCLKNDALEKINNSFERESCDMVMFNTGECFDFPTISVKHNLRNGKVWECEDKKEIYHQIIGGKIPNNVCTKAVRASCAKVPDWFYDCNAKHGEDLLMSVHLLTNCKKIVFIAEGLYFYRNRPGSAIHSFNPQRTQSIKIVHTELEKYIDIWKMPELKPLHNARKVRGWIENVKLFIRCRKSMSREELKREFRNMSQDPYFVFAYKNMDRTQLSFAYRIFAHLLYGKQYYLLLLVYYLIKVLKSKGRKIWQIIAE